MEDKKTVLGQFFTKDKIWLKPQILDFIKNSNCNIAYDPFAGAGHLLDVAKKIGFLKTKGLDIDGTLGWNKNDSLKNIPHLDDRAIIITNPPYLSNYSASRKGILHKVEEYFNQSIYDDLYLIALDNMLKSQKNVVAIIPETFINSNFRKKNYLHSITILEDNPFDDTDTPVLVACFDGVFKSFSDVLVYKNDVLINDLGTLENMRLIPKYNLDIVFNDKNGWLAVRCVDTTNPKERLKFDLRENIDYDWIKGIKGTSRLLTLIDLEIPHELRNCFIEECNTILNKLRKDTEDIVLSPFKGNMKNGKRRRRLDFGTCRAIIEKACARLAITGEKKYEQLLLF